MRALAESNHTTSRGRRARPRSRYVTANGVRQHFVEWPGSERVTLVFIHGSREHGHAWDEVVEALPRDWRALAVDLRGHGDSAWATGSSYALWDYVADIDALLRATLDAGPVALVGHSLGGAIALQLAGARPGQMAAVVALEPFGMGRGLTNEVFSAKGVPEMVKVTPSEGQISATSRLGAYLSAIESGEGRTQPGYSSVDEAVARMQAANPRLPAEAARRMVRYGLRRGRDGRHTWKFDQRVRFGTPFSFSMEDAAALWSEIRCPVLFVDGADNGGRTDVSDSFVHLFPGARRAKIEGAGHGMHQEQPAALAEVIREFVCDQLAGER